MKSNHEKIYEKIKDETLQHGINREAAKITALSSGKIDKYEYLTGKKILPSDQSRMIEAAEFIYFSCWNAFKNKQGRKQVEALKS